MLYVGLLKLVWKFQQVQNVAVSLSSGTTRDDHISPVLAHTHWLSISFLGQSKVLVITYKTLNGLGPQYLSAYLSYKTATCPSQSRMSKDAPPKRSKQWISGTFFFQLWPHTYGIDLQQRLAKHLPSPFLKSLLKHNCLKIFLKLVLFICDVQCHLELFVFLEIGLAGSVVLLTDFIDG